MDELKRALEDILFLIDMCVPIETFENGVNHNGIDEGEVLASQLIGKAKGVLFNNMSETETESSPLLNKGPYLKTKKDQDAW